MYLMSILRIMAPGGKYGVHPNCFFMTKAAYLYLNGYDEDFCGHYGDDLYMNQWINKNMDVYNCGEKMFLTEGCE